VAHVADLDEDQLMAKLDPAPCPELNHGSLPVPDFGAVHRELKTN
jgi:hypothetical protein